MPDLTDEHKDEVESWDGSSDPSEVQKEGHKVLEHTATGGGEDAGSLEPGQPKSAEG
jgi:hypothetical protein